MQFTISNVLHFCLLFQSTCPTHLGIYGNACQNTSIDTGAARPCVRAYASSYANLPKFDLITASRATHGCTSARRYTHENVPTKELHMPRFHREEMASSANAVVFMLWYAFARSVALLTPAARVTRHTYDPPPLAANFTSSLLGIHEQAHLWAGQARTPPLARRATVPRCHAPIAEQYGHCFHRRCSVE
jgi:hypothetical protein